MEKMTKRAGTVVGMAIAFVLGAAGVAFADGGDPTPVEAVIDAATGVVTTNVPLIAAGLAALLAVALGITALWTAFGNAKKGVRQMK